MDVSIFLALAAGGLAAVNPCGFALLPAYLSLLVVGDDPQGRAPVRRALAPTAAMTAGFVAVLGVFGLVIAPVAAGVQRHLPWFTVGFGLLLVVLGGWLLAGRRLPTLRLARVRAGTVTRSLPSMALFGAAYALASLSCTVGPFLAIVVSSLRAGSILSGIGLFLAYAAGMGLVVATAALAVALARDSLLTRLRRAGPMLSRLGGLLMALAGAYVAYHGWYEVRLLSGRTAPDPVVNAGSALQHALAAGLDSLGAGPLAIAFALLLAVATAAGYAHQRRTRP